MKALTNILTRLLMLMLLMLVACTEETAEVDNLVRGEEYVTVRMQVSGMKNATTRADEAEDNLTSVVVLVFRNDALVSKTEVTTASSTLTTTSTTGTFNIPRPQSGDIIHFLGNLPESVKNSLPATGGTQEDVLRGLITDDDENLSYWGTATYTSGDVIDNVTLYRNMAKIEIAAGDECTFPEDQLFIVGLVNANQVGALVPYNGSFNFDLTTNDYFTLPADVETETDEDAQPLVTSLYVFEHENPETEKGLYVICKIGGKYYYKVALIDDTTDQPYDIVRNHRYVIYVNDLEEGVRTYELALKADPVNFEVVEMKDVTLTLTPKANTLYYNSTSEEAVTVTVGDIDSAVETLTFTAPGFTILSDYATDEGNGVFRITDRTKEAINFTLTLTDPNQTNAGTVSVTAAGKYVNSSNNPSTTIQLSERAASSGETIMWQGAVEMHNNTADGTTHAGKVLIPYSFFFDANGTQKIPVNSKISLEYDKNETGYIQTYLFKDGEPSIWDISNGTELTLTQDLLTKIKDNHKEVWDIDAAFVFEGGGGAVLKKVTLIPAKESITAEADKSQLYYDSDEPQVVTVNVTVPNGVSAITIGGAEKFTIAKTAGNGTLDGTTYTLGNERTATFTFTLNQKNVTEEQVITFSGDNVNAASVPISMVQTPTVTFTNTGSQTLYWNNGKPTNFQVQMTGNNVPNDKTITLTITAPDFTVSATNGQLAQNGNVWAYTGTLTTLTFTPTSSGDDKPINITGEGENVNVNPASISVDVDATLLAVTSTATINMDNSETSTILTLTKPGNITNLKVTASNNNAFTINGNEINGDYYIGGLSSNNATIDYTIALRDGFNTAGEYTITFTDNGGGGQSVTATITVKNTPSLQFEYEDNTILYLDGGDGSPTTLPVTITVPEGSSLTQLNITATGFTVTASSGTLSGSEGSYTYTGGSTTFTFVPTAVGIDKTITFTGSGTNLKNVNETITVDVSATKPAGDGNIVIWESVDANGTPVTWDRTTSCRISSNNFEENIDGLKVNDQITINYKGTQSCNIQIEYGDDDKTKVQIKGNNNNDNGIACNSGTGSYTFTVNSENMVNMLLSYGLVFIGDGTSILSITAKVAE